MAFLSICIPTINRAKQLKITLDSLTTQPSFLNTNDIEIIISDNCSTDNTGDISKEFVKQFPDKIKYFGNEINIEDANFEKALSLGSGEFLKLYNDTLVMKPNALSEILQYVKENSKERPVLFFSNGEVKSNDKFLKFNNLDDFIKKVSYNCTWIGAFGMWKEDFKKTEDFGRCTNLKLSQVDVLLRMIIEKSNSVVFTTRYVEVLGVKNKGGFNIAEVFGQNYFTILEEYVKSGALKSDTYRNERKNTLFNQIIPYYFDFKSQWAFEKGDYLHFMRACRFDWFFYLSFLLIAFKKLRYGIKYKLQDVKKEPK